MEIVRRESGLWIPGSRILRQVLRSAPRNDRTGRPRSAPASRTLRHRAPFEGPERSASYKQRHQPAPNENIKRPSAVVCGEKAMERQVLTGGASTHRVPFRRTLIGVALGAAFALAAGPALAQEKQLTVWWVKGFYKSEDDALFEAIKKFEAKTGVKVDLSQYAVQDMIPKTVSALDAGTPPDVAYADVYDFQVAGKWAYDGKLEDLSDVINPIKERFAPNTVETTFLYNDKAKKKAYYGFPTKQQTMHIEYWIDMLATAGFKESDIPTGWKDYWSFWCDKVQPGYRKATSTRGFGIGQPMGVDSSDSFDSFLTFADAYNVKLVDDDGKLLVDDPKVREGLIGALTDYTAPYTKGCTPPS